MDVWLLNWSAKMEGHRIRIAARHQSMELSLGLTPRKALVFHGKEGLSRKGPKEGQASYYFSYTDLETQGSIRTPLSQTPVSVQGVSWFDHEFGSNQLASNQVGWDWFSLHLSDGHDLMVYFLRRMDGSVELASSGTLVSPAGKARDLPYSEIRVEVLDYWRSLKSGGKYPSRWRIRVPSAKVDVVVAPLVPQQELITEGSSGVIYWEGAVEGKDNRRAKKSPVKGTWSLQVTPVWADCFELAGLPTFISEYREEERCTQGSLFSDAEAGEARLSETQARRGNFYKCLAFLRSK
jgi:predicted secreted hydrolase